jgi:hypothetical protein
VAEPQGPGSLPRAPNAADAMADPVFAGLLQRIPKHFFSQTALD